MSYYLLLESFIYTINSHRISSIIKKGSYTNRVRIWILDNGKFECWAKPTTFSESFNPALRNIWRLNIKNVTDFNVLGSKVDIINLIGNKEINIIAVVVLKGIQKMNDGFNIRGNNWGSQCYFYIFEEKYTKFTIFTLFRLKMKEETTYIILGITFPYNSKT